MGHGTKIGGVNKLVTGGCAKVGGVEYTVAKGLTLVSGVQRDINFLKGTPIGNLAVGTSVYTNVDGVRTKFIIVHQGKPSSLYDSSCSGTWLLMNDLLPKIQWDYAETAVDAQNNYANSYVHDYLMNTILGKFDSGVQTKMKTVKIPYYNGSGIASGANGLSTKLFLLGGYEVGYTTDLDSALAEDGAKLSYFQLDNTSSSSNPGRTARVGYLDGVATHWWLRSASVSNSSIVFCVYKSGTYYRVSAHSVFAGVRPAFIVPQNLGVDDNFNIIA